MKKGNYFGKILRSGKIVIFLFLGTFDEQKNTKVCANEFFGFMPS